MSLSKAQIKEIVNYASKIIYDNEGAYGSVNKNDNGAVSIGKVQWHGNRALSLIKVICATDGAQSKSILGDTLYNEVVAASTTAWTNRVASITEAAVISILLTTVPGKIAQDMLAEADITAYIERGISYGLSDYGALIYFADGVNQYGTGSPLWKDAAAKALTGAGDVEAIHNATMSLTANYIARRTRVFNAVRALNIYSSGAKEAKSMLYTAKGLADYAHECQSLNTRYMWGSFGQKITTAFINSKKSQYSKEYTAEIVTALNAVAGKDFYAFDCGGLIKSYYWGGYKNLKYVSAQDKSANSMLGAATVKGAINTMSEVPGLCVWLDGHIGVYIGGGYVIESTPNKQFGDGVCKTKLSDRKWQQWLQCPYIDYTGTSLRTNCYAVKAGDSLWTIASKLLGNGTRYKEIMALNGLKTDIIRPGQLLNIPEK